MKFIADLHIHSKFSRATAKNLDFENLFIAAQLKGITVVGTGDFTHPGWFAEIREKLIPAEEGLFRLAPDLAARCRDSVPKTCHRPVRFLLSAEISNIYKKDGRTRKNHNLVFSPDMETAERIREHLDRVGNIRSDGRPILGLDARDLLEIILSVSEANYLIPAHIWTPWFSLLGSKSGFDSVEECFGDLSDRIFALETGLSSDPPMNSRVSGLDRFALVSNSDAHSPAKLGREANLFDTGLGYTPIRKALESGDEKRFLGTYEFFPEEGKYHFDGHRKCRICFAPGQTRAAGGLCPECGKPLTLGVLNRVEALSDRKPETASMTSPWFRSLIPLVDILSEIFRVGPGSKKVGAGYRRAIKRLGSEFDILQKIDPERIDEAGIPLLGEAIRRTRQGKVVIDPGYDGEFGKVSIFGDGEREKILGQNPLFVQPTLAPISEPPPPLSFPEPVAGGSIRADKGPASDPVVRLNPDQLRAVESGDGAMFIKAGPGTGKTLTLTRRIAHLIRVRGIDPETILAVTFTHKAAEEMRERLDRLLDAGPRPLTLTFHALCLFILKEEKVAPAGIVDDAERMAIVKEATAAVRDRGIDPGAGAQEILSWIVSAKQRLRPPGEAPESAGGAEAVYRAYQERLEIEELADYEDLILKTALRLETVPACREWCRKRFRHLFIDEYQDLNYGQYRLVRLLFPEEDPGRNICVIGDPDQSIYGFRGSDFSFFGRFTTDFPSTERVELTRNYRSTETILRASHQVIARPGNVGAGSRIYSGIEGVNTLGIISAAHEKAEAVATGRIIENLVGGTGFHSIDFDKVDPGSADAPISFSEVAVLFRTGRQTALYEEILTRAGLPCQVARRKSFMNRPGIREFISLIRMTAGCGGYLDMERIAGTLKAGIGKRGFSAFKRWGIENRFPAEQALGAARRFPVAGMRRTAQLKLCEFTDTLHRFRREITPLTGEKKLHYLSEHIDGLPASGEDPAMAAVLQRMISTAGRSPKPLETFLSETMLGTDTDLYDSRAERISLMTLHAAKGLEFSVVFIAGCEQGLIPFGGTESRQVDPEEERRLFYVAMTRARDRLYLTWARRRRRFGKTELQTLSPFVREIENRLLKATGPAPKEKKRQEQLDLF